MLRVIQSIQNPVFVQRYLPRLWNKTLPIRWVAEKFPSPCKTNKQTKTNSENKAAILNKFTSTQDGRCKLILLTSQHDTYLRGPSSHFKGLILSPISLRSLLCSRSEAQSMGVQPLSQHPRLKNYVTGALCSGERGRILLISDTGKQMSEGSVLTPGQTWVLVTIY